MKAQHKGSCHCGNITYQANVDTSSGLSCNCSLCQRKGTLLAFTPKSDFQLTVKDKVTGYKFNKMIIEHQFCPVCGVSTHAYAKDPKGVETVAVNLRTLTDIDLDSVKVNFYDGKAT